MAQSARMSRWEVGLDFCFSIVINLGIQAVFFTSFSMGRGLSYSVVFLSLSFVRRYAVRRSFNYFVAAGQAQPRHMSLIEVSTDTILGFALSLVLLSLWYPSEPLPKVTGLIASSYVLTLIRRFALRRLFEWHARLKSEVVLASSH